MLTIAAPDVAAQGKARTSPQAAAQAATGALPAPVVQMREAILAAVASGRIEDLRDPLAWNELPPVIADGPVDDPIAYWKAQSADGEGREILAVLAELLAGPPAVLPVGRDIENSRLYVWPALSERPLDALTSAEEVELTRLLPPAVLDDMRTRKRWTWYRLVIGADGTWHAFQKGN